MKILFLLFLIFGMLQAERNVLLNQKARSDAGRIVDIGSKEQIGVLPINKSIVFSEPLTRAINNNVQLFARNLDIVGCETDPFGNEACPRERQTCTGNQVLNSGTSVRHEGVVYAAKIENPGFTTSRTLWTSVHLSGSDSRSESGNVTIPAGGILSIKHYSREACDDDRNIVSISINGVARSDILCNASADTGWVSIFTNSSQAEVIIPYTYTDAHSGGGYDRSNMYEQIEVPVIYTCPAGYADNGTNCKKTYSYYTYHCPIDIDANGNAWIGPVINSGGDCQGINLVNGFCNLPIPPPNGNCVRNQYSCPTAGNECILSANNSTPVENVFDGYIYKQGSSSQFDKKIVESVNCPDTTVNNTYSCQENWILSIDKCYLPIAVTDIKTTPMNGYSIGIDSKYFKNLDEAESIIKDGTIYKYVKPAAKGIEQSTQSCISEKTSTCPDESYIYDAVSNNCFKAPNCAAYIDGKCYSAPQKSCIRGSFDEQLDRCIEDTSCENGTMITVPIDENTFIESCFMIPTMTCPSSDLTYTSTLETGKKTCFKNYIPETAYCQGIPNTSGECLFTNFSNWTTSGSGWSVSSTTATQSQNTTSDSFVLYPTSVEDFELDISLRGTGTDNDILGLTFGYVDSDNNYLLMLSKQTDTNTSSKLKFSPVTEAVLIKKIAGKYNVIDSFNFGWTTTNSLIKINVTRTNGLKIYKNGSLIGAYINEKPSGKFGLYSYSQTGIFSMNSFKTLPTCLNGKVYDEISRECHEQIGLGEFNGDLNIYEVLPECPNGGTLNTVTKKCELPSLTEYRCSTGDLFSGTCSYAASTEEICVEDALPGNASIDVFSPNRILPTGVYIGNKTCKYENSRKMCPAGYQLIGGQCVDKSFQNASYNFTCPNARPGVSASVISYTPYSCTSGSLNSTLGTCNIGTSYNFPITTCIGETSGVDVGEFAGRFTTKSAEACQIFDATMERCNDDFTGCTSHLVTDCDAISTSGGTTPFSCTNVVPAQRDATCQFNAQTRYSCPLGGTNGVDNTLSTCTIVDPTTVTCPANTSTTTSTTMSIITYTGPIAYTCSKSTEVTSVATATYSCSSGVLSGTNCITTVAAAQIIDGYTISATSLNSYNVGLEKSGNNFRFRSGVNYGAWITMLVDGSLSGNSLTSSMIGLEQVGTAFRYKDNALVGASTARSIGKLSVNTVITDMFITTGFSNSGSGFRYYSSIGTAYRSNVVTWVPYYQPLTCPINYVLSGTNCVNTIPAAVSYSCPVGTILSGLSCIATTVATVAAIQTCPIGYTVNTTNHTCTKIYAGTPYQYCASGSLVNINKCQYIATRTMGCADSSYSLTGNNNCEKTLTQAPIKDFFCSRLKSRRHFFWDGTAPEEWWKYEDRLDNYFTYTPDTCHYESTTKYNCSAGHTLMGETCQYNATAIQTCPINTTLSNGKCVYDAKLDFCPGGNPENFDPLTDTCSFQITCDNPGETLFIDQSGRRFCLSDATFTCSSGAYKNTSNLTNLFSTQDSYLQGACEIIGECGTDQSIIKDGLNMCINTNIKIECPAGFSVFEINGEEKCVAIPTCKPGWVKENDSCILNYKWYEYACEQGWDGPNEIWNKDFKAGGDCKGSCGFDGCSCNSPESPANSCRQGYSLNATSYSLIEKKPMITHPIIGETINKNEMNVVRNENCGTNQRNCDSGLEKIVGNGSQLCFYMKNDKNSCFTVDGCSFSGKIEPLISDPTNMITHLLMPTPYTIKSNFVKNIGSSSCYGNFPNATVFSWYTEHLCRCPDQAGYDYWINDIAARGEATTLLSVKAAVAELGETWQDSCPILNLNECPEGSFIDENANECYQAISSTCKINGHVGWKEGLSFTNISTNAVNCTGVYPNATVLDWYSNHLCRCPDQAGYDYWINDIASGRSVTDVLVDFKTASSSRSEPWQDICPAQISSTMTERQNPISAIGNSNLVGMYTDLTVVGSADLKDGTIWNGFNAATMALKFSNGHWYSIANVNDSNGNAVTINKNSVIRSLNNSYYDIKKSDINQTFACMYKNSILDNELCGDIITIRSPEEKLELIAIADIEVIELDFGGVLNSNFDNELNISINGINMDSQVIFQLPQDSTIEKEDSDFNSINNRIRFWDSYQDGYLGFLEFVNEVGTKNRTLGFVPEFFDYELVMADGFTSISLMSEKDAYLTLDDQSLLNYTYFVKPTMTTASECSLYASKYHLTAISQSDFLNNPGLGKLPQVLGMIESGACILFINDVKIPSINKNAIKKKTYTGSADYVCSRLSCKNNECGYANCPDGTQSNLFPRGYHLESGACTAQSCDYSKPYGVCGIPSGCPTDVPTIFQRDGHCLELYCTTGSMNYTNMKCESLGCPPNTTEVNGKCVE